MEKTCNHQSERQGLSDAGIGKSMAIQPRINLETHPVLLLAVQFSQDRRLARNWGRTAEAFATPTVATCFHIQCINWRPSGSYPVDPELNRTEGSKNARCIVQAQAVVPASPRAAHRRHRVPVRRSQPPSVAAPCPLLHHPLSLPRPSSRLSTPLVPTVLQVTGLVLAIGGKPPPSSATAAVLAGRPCTEVVAAHLHCWGRGLSANRVGQRQARWR
uniref:Uncharacterized protein n=1 Tax=Oryza rufipogon TaxID=4529 RepID=A0A0E0RAK5_ORYRU